MSGGQTTNGGRAGGAPRASGEPIAIVGIACRYPGGASTPEAFWRLLLDGVNAIRPIEREGMELERWYDPKPATPGRMVTRFGGFLENLELFDAEFFGISPREASSLDPAQRLLLETVWEAIEDAIVDPASLRGEPVGVYVGQWLSDFEARLYADTTQVDLYATTGSGRYASSGRLSYFLGVTGPSLTVDTACSSSLVALHLACQSLRAGESSLAVAAGVNVILQPHITIAYSQSGMMAPDGRCKFGDANGDGYVRSEGVGVVLLKPLARALADGDPIRAVIRGSAVNNDGSSSGHLATPSREGQAAMLRTAYADAGVAPAHVKYVEAHGTGTRAGDPIELGALGDVLASGRPAGSRCFVGSVKSNIGHTEGAAGMAGILKSVLTLQHAVVPASLHLTEPNPTVPWAELPFDVPRAAEPWPADGRPRLAGVSAFGITGTNAHVVLEEAPAPRPAGARNPGDVLALILSAVTPAALQALAAAHADDLETQPTLSLGDLAATLARHRAAFDHRAVFVGSDRAGMIERLRRFAAGDMTAADVSGSATGGARRRIAFVFSGQGGQWPGMTRELLEHEPVFRELIAKCDAAMPEGRGWSVLEQLEVEPDSPRYRLNEIGVLQPTLLAVQISLAELWRARGITPDAVVGHSVGEAGGAYLAGVLSLSDAMRVICGRSALMQRTSGKGGMALVGLGLEETKTRIGNRGDVVSVAASNGPRSTIISGDPAAIAAILAELEPLGVFCRTVQVDVASHSPQMQPLVPELVASLGSLSAHAESTALYSTVYARRVEGKECDAEYWGRNLRQPVMFGPTVERLLADGIDTFIEVGPHPTLLASVAEAKAAEKPLTLHSLRRNEPERAALLASFGALWVAGHPVNWSTFFPAGTYARVRLAHYPWQRERHWSNAALAVYGDGAVKRRSPLDDQLRSWLYVPRWDPSSVDTVDESLARWLIVAPSANGQALAASLRELKGPADVVPSVDEAIAWIGRTPPSALRGLGVAFLSEASAKSPAAEVVETLQRVQRAWPAEANRWTPRLWWVTSGAQAAPGDLGPPKAAGHASIWGAARVIASEHPTWWGGLADVGNLESGVESTLLARHLRSGSAEDQVAIRGDERFVLRIVNAEATPEPAGPAYRWRSDAAYLITGGLGGIALEIAKAMVDEGARRLVLLGRSGLPPRAEWAAEPEASKNGRRIAAIRALEHRGASVHLVQADIANLSEVRAALDAYRKEGWPPIRGVVHTAAVMENKLTTEMDGGTFERAMRPKLEGALVLDELFPALDLFVLFSSIAAFWGPAGTANYSAANAAVDALAQARRARGQHAISIQWGHWESIGLSSGATADRIAEELKRGGVGSMSTAQGIAAFEWFLTRPEPVMSVLPVDWQAFREARRGRDWPLFRAVHGMGAGGDGATKSFAERMGAASPVERRTLIEGIVKEALGAVLRRPANQLDTRRAFGSSGLDSLMALEFRNRLESAIERSLPATLAWNYPTIAQLATYLDGLFGAEPTGAEAAPAVPTGPEVADPNAVRLVDDIASLSDAEAARALRRRR